MKKETIENIRRIWNAQTFQYDYISHLKGKFVFAHFVACIFICFLIGYMHHYWGLLFVPCAVSWDYFTLFDKSRKAYKDGYVPQRYERVGTLCTTISLSIMLCLTLL